jgi:hypothetical protein
MNRRTFLALVAMAKHAAKAFAPRSAPMFVGITPGFNAAMKANVAVQITQRKTMARVLITKDLLDTLDTLDPPPCLAFPGGAFTRAMHAETERLIYDMRRTEEGFISWMDRPHKGPRGRVRRAPGNLPKRLRKAERRRRTQWQR